MPGHILITSSISENRLKQYGATVQCDYRDLHVESTIPGIYTIYKYLTNGREIPFMHKS